MEAGSRCGRSRPGSRWWWRWCRAGWRWCFPLRPDLELHPLRQRQVGPPVEGAGLAAHVGLPGVGAGLAAAAGLLLAAEGAADLRPAGADVHVHDAAVAAAGRHETVGLAQVGGEDAGGEALRHAVVDRDGVLELAVLHSVEDGGEGLL